MLEIEKRSRLIITEKDKHVFKVLELKEEEFESLVTSMAKILPDFYVSPESVASTLEQLGKQAAAQKVKLKLPLVKKSRSGDVGEIMLSDYIDEVTPYTVPIRKLRWKDHVNQAMRGDDIIGLYYDQQKGKMLFIKGEAKSYQALSRAVLESARKELDLDDGKPSPHALAFVAERLRDTGDADLANLIEKAMLVDGIHKNQVEHILFTFTKSNPATLQKEAFEDYQGDVVQRSVGVRFDKHQELIEAVYAGALNALDS